MDFIPPPAEERQLIHPTVACGVAFDLLLHGTKVTLKYVTAGLSIVGHSTSRPRPAISHKFLRTIDQLAKARRDSLRPDAGHMTIVAMSWSW